MVERILLLYTRSLKDDYNVSVRKSCIYKTLTDLCGFVYLQLSRVDIPTYLVIVFFAREAGKLKKKLEVESLWKTQIYMRTYKLKFKKHVSTIPLKIEIECVILAS